jgi:RNA polymerase sigma-70 factor (ECF subfamily)
LVRRFQDVAFRTAYLLLADAQEAEDVTQEAFLKAYLALGRFRTGAPFRPWLLEIVANTARNRRRSAGRRAHLVLRLAASAPGQGLGPSPEIAALANEQRAALVQAVNELTEEYRLAIACRYFLDLSEAETATLLGVARGTVKSRLSRALDRLRGELARQRPDGGVLAEVDRG